MNFWSNTDNETSADGNFRKNTIKCLNFAEGIFISAIESFYQHEFHELTPKNMIMDIDGWHARTLTKRGISWSIIIFETDSRSLILILTQVNHHFTDIFYGLPYHYNKVNIIIRKIVWNFYQTYFNWINS